MSLTQHCSVRPFLFNICLKPSFDVDVLLLLSTSYVSPALATFFAIDVDIFFPSLYMNCLECTRTNIRAWYFWFCCLAFLVSILSRWFLISVPKMTLLRAPESSSALWAWKNMQQVIYFSQKLYFNLFKKILDYFWRRY